MNQAHLSPRAQPYSSNSPPPSTLHSTFCEFNPNSISFLPSLVYIISALIAVQIGQKEPIKKA